MKLTGQGEKAAGAVPTKAAIPRRPKWHRVYFVLVAFDVLTVCFGLIVNHRLRTIYTQSVAVNQDWQKRRENYQTLGGLGQAVNAPGNDVFDTHEVKTESSKMDSALAAFEKHLRTLREELDTNSVPAEDEKEIRESLSAVDKAMVAMVAEARHIFSLFLNQRAEEAGKRMAAMDRCYAEFTKALGKVLDETGKIQNHLFDIQAARAASLQKFETLLAAFVLLMVLGASIYGHRLSRQMARDALEKEDYITGLRTADERLRHAHGELQAAKDHAEAATRAKSEFLASMSHEIRTPLNGVMGMLSLLARSELTDRQRELTSIAHTSANTLLGLINDLLDFSKIEAGKMVLETAPFDLLLMVEEVGDMFAVRA